MAVNERVYCRAYSFFGSCVVLFFFFTDVLIKVEMGLISH